MSSDGSPPPDPLNDPAYRDRRSLYLEDWATLVEPRNSNGARMIGHSVTYGSGALQASYIINGGALAALPTFFTVFTAAKPADIVAAAYPFVLSIMATGIASSAAYLNFQWHAALSFHDAEHTGAMLRRFYERSDAEGPSPEKRNGLMGKIWWSFGIGFGAAILALGLFIFGTWQIKGLAERVAPAAQIHASIPHAR